MFSNISSSTQIVLVIVIKNKVDLVVVRKLNFENCVSFSHTKNHIYFLILINLKLQIMGQQHKECAFKDHQVMMKKDVPIQCGIIEKSTCVSVMEIFATHLTKYQYHLYSFFLF